MPDINFQCPICGGPVIVPEEMANQLVECPTCKQTVEVPVRTRSQEFVSFAAHASGDESIFFQSGDVLVTNARFAVGAKTFTMRSITSVEVVESEEVVKQQGGEIKSAIMIGLGLTIIVVGIICTMYGFDHFGYGVLIVAGLIGLVMLIVGGSLSTQSKRAFKLVLKTAGGDVMAYQSFDQEHISQIIRALNDSIISHG